MTLREQNVEALKILGHVEIKTHSQRVALQAPGGKGPIYFVGHNGSVRRGETLTASIPVPCARILHLAKRVKEGKPANDREDSLVIGNVLLPPS